MEVMGCGAGTEQQDRDLGRSNADLVAKRRQRGAVASEQHAVDGKQDGQRHSGDPVVESRR
jgi:hypothetical protein